MAVAMIEEFQMSPKRLELLRHAFEELAKSVDRSGCLKDEEIILLWDHRLSRRDRRRVEQHLCFCHDCRSAAIRYWEVANGAGLIEQPQRASLSQRISAFLAHTWSTLQGFLSTVFRRRLIFATAVVVLAVGIIYLRGRWQSEVAQLRAELESQHYVTQTHALRAQIESVRLEQGVWRSGGMQPNAVQLYTAVRAVTTRANLTGTEFDHRLTEAMYLMITNNPVSAIEGLLRQAQNAYEGSDPIVLKAIGAAYRVIGSNQLSKIIYQRLITEHPDDCQGYNYLGYANYKLGDLSSAENAYKQALTLRPTYSKAWYNLALAVKARGALKESDEYMNRALQLADAEKLHHPDCAKVYFTLSLIYKQRGDLSNAILYLSNAAQLSEEFRYWAVHEDAFADMRTDSDFQKLTSTIDPTKVIAAWEKEGTDIFSDECTP